MDIKKSIKNTCRTNSNTLIIAYLLLQMLCWEPISVVLANKAIKKYVIENYLHWTLKLKRPDITLKMHHM